MFLTSQQIVHAEGKCATVGTAHHVVITITWVCGIPAKVSTILGFFLMDSYRIRNGPNLRFLQVSSVSLLCTYNATMLFSFTNYKNDKTSIPPISSKRIKLSGTPSTGVGQTHSNQQMVRWQGNLGRISESEKVSFKMVTERNYAIWWLNMFREWIPKSRDSNWNSTSPSMSFSPGNSQMNRVLWAWVIRKAWKIDMKIHKMCVKF